MSRTVYTIIEEDNVGATTDSFTGPVASGKKAVVKVFGAAIPGTGVVDLHFGDDANGWTLIRSIANGTYEHKDINEDVVGDGVKMFRVSRTKLGGGGPLAIRTWFRAIDIDV